MLVFALGIGLATAMFALTDPYILRPLPYADPDELAVIQVGPEGLTPSSLIPTVAEWRSHTSLFKALTAHEYGRTERLRLADRSVSAYMHKISTNFFDVLGVHSPPPGFWQVSTSASDVPVVLMSAALPVLLGDAKVGHTLQRQDGGSLNVVGIVPPGFLFPDPKVGNTIVALTPYTPGHVITISWMTRNGLPVGRGSGPMMLARLQPGVTPDVVRQALARPLPSGRLLDVRVTWLSEWMTQEVRPLAIGSFAASVLVLVICAGNVANLLVARSAYRLREFATREALGASRVDIARLWLMELVVTAGAALIIALAVASLTVRVAARVIPDDYVALGTPAMSWRVSGFAAISAFGIVVLGSAPAALFARLATRELFQNGSIGRSSPVAIVRFVFAAVQAAFAMVLAVGASMLVLSYVKLMQQDTGYDAAAVAVRVTYPFALLGPRVYDDVQASIDELRRIRGVVAVAATPGPVVGEAMSKRAVRVDGAQVSVDSTEVTPGFFDAVGMTILQGRALLPTDEHGQGVVVNDAFVRQFWPHSSPLAQTIGIADRNAAVVGVVRSALDKSLDTPPTPTIYTVMGKEHLFPHIVYVLSARNVSMTYGEEIRRALFLVNADGVIERIDSVGRRLAQTVRTRTFATLILTCFGVAGGVVTLAGLAGIVSFVIARRTREIAIRMAIGATSGDVLRFLVRESVAAAIAGGAAGLLVGRWLSTLLGKLVYGLEAGNWTIALATAAVLMTVMVTTALLSARRALHLQPSSALRVE